MGRSKGLVRPLFLRDTIVSYRSRFRKYRDDADALMEAPYIMVTSRFGLAAKLAMMVA